MKTKNKMIAFVQIAVVLCSMFLMAIPAIAADQTTQEVSASEVTTASEDGYVLEIYGNANKDDTIDMGDVVYIKLAIFGKKSKTELCDAKYDGRINVLDVIQTKLIILGKEKELTFVDTADRIVTVKKPIKKIVVAHFNTVETMRSIKATEKIVGVSSTDDIFFPEFSDYPSVGSERSPDIEKVLELKPDVVFCNAYYAIKYKETSELLKKLELADPNIAVVTFYCYKPESYVEEIRKLGYILEKEEEAEKFIDFYERCLITIKERVDDIPEDERPRVYFEFRKPYRTAGGNTGYQQKIEMGGGNNIFSDLSELYPTVDPEEVIKRDPELIVSRVHSRWGGYDIDDTTGMRDIWDEIIGRSELEKVSAVKNKRVYIVCGPLSGPDHFIGIAYFAKWFHPNLFEDLDPRAIHQDYLTRFQGLDYDLDEHGVFVYHPEEHPEGH